MKEIKTEIKKDSLIWKFCFYGFFKNLKFFEPYLIYYLMSLDISLLKIGWLYAIREIIIYVFEIPSGVIADYYGKKTELQICFVFYMMSFVGFAIASNMIVISIAMILFGLGEAFRSGTHKAMIMTYLEEKNWLKYKTYIYGRTRSFSLLASAISGILSIVLVLYFPLKYLFLICIIPYIIDFLLIGSYPKRFNQRKANSWSAKEFVAEIKAQLKRIKGRRDLQKIIVSSSLFDAIFKLLKDYIQAIIKTMIGIGAIASIGSLDRDMSTKVILGIIYGVTYLLSAVASRNIYRLNSKYSSEIIMNVAFDLFGLVLLAIGCGLLLENMLLVIVLYLLTYIIQNARRPAFVDVVGDRMKKDQRATVLSVESQLKSFFMIILAPIFGFIADTLGLMALFVILGIIVMAMNKFLNIENKLP